MARQVAVILVVGLNRALLAHAPRLSAWSSGKRVRSLRPVLPAVTCSVQASMLTGLMPREHGIVGNGWYNRELSEIQFWKQSNLLVQGEKVWETARRRDPTVTCANLFWWYNMYSSVDWSVTPRPIYKADGRKLRDVHTHPSDLRDSLQEKLGKFPLFQFWGPGASIISSRWIAQAAKVVFDQCLPTLTLVYLPHLDYALQKSGPEHVGIPNEVAQIDAVAADLIDHLEAAGVRVLVVSEYGIESVDGPVHINRALRQAGLLQVREEDGLELLDAGASDAFAVADHQIAHVYLKHPENASLLQRTIELCKSVPGVGQVLDRVAQATVGLDHPRAGDLVLIAGPRKWFTYYYWLNDAQAPDFARTVEIHRKPGYDPCELFINPAIQFPKAALAWRLVKRKLGFRTLMDVIPLDASLVRGSHGCVSLDVSPDKLPVLISRTNTNVGPEELPATAVRDVILEEMFGTGM